MRRWFISLVHLAAQRRRLAVALLRSIGKPNALFGSVALVSLWVVPPCFGLQPIARKVYTSMLWSGPVDFGEIDMLFVASMLASGCVFALAFRFIKSSVAAIAVWTGLTTLASFFVYRRIGFDPTEQTLSSLAAFVLLIVSALLLMRRYGARWWVFAAACISAAILKSLLLMVVIPSPVTTTDFVKTAGLGLIDGLLLYLAFYLVACAACTADHQSRRAFKSPSLTSRRGTRARR